MIYDSWLSLKGSVSAFRSVCLAYVCLWVCLRGSVCGGGGGGSAA